MPADHFIPTTLNIDLDALARNFNALETISGVPVHPVVKADSYGLGADRCAARLLREGARTFFVARASEGLALRAAIGNEPVIYVLDGCHGEAAATLRLADLRPVLNQACQLATWEASGGGACGLQIDTGMNRLGFRPDDAPQPFEGLEMVMSHLACSDDPSDAMNKRQRDTFSEVSRLYPQALGSLANSGGCFLGPDYAFDAVRPGISLYGGGPQGRPDPAIAAVATLTAEVIQVRNVEAGESVGYSCGYIASEPTTIATCSAGYADGLLRSYSADGRGRVWLNGALRPIVGRISMDVFAVDVTGAEVGVGDLAELFGPNLNLDDVATAAGTISYELMTSITSRVARSYAGQG